MSSDGVKFDPYFKWLGIPRREQPPHHYRLLGIAMYEADAHVIDTAAQRQAQFIKGCGETKFSDIADKLITQIAAARECLLDESAKAAYDEELRSRQAKAPAAPRKTRFDALQVSAVDTAVQTAEPGPTRLPRSQPMPVEPAEKDEGIIDLGSLGLADEPVNVAPPPVHVPPSVAAPAAPRAAMPPVVMADGGSDVSTALVIKLVVGGCVLAGGITFGLLSWLSSGKATTSGASEPTSVNSIASPAPAEATAVQPATAPTASVAAPAKTPATVPAGAPAVAPAVASTANPKTPAPAKPAAPTKAPATAAAAVPTPAAPAPPPAVAAPAAQFAGTSWQVTSANVKGVITYHPDGKATFSGAKEPGTWNCDGTNLTAQITSNVFHFRVTGNKELTGMISGMPAKAVPASTPAPAKTATPAKPAVRAPAPTVPGAPVAPAAAEGADDAAKPGAPQSEWVLPFRNVPAFRGAWVKGDPATSVDFDPETRIVTLEGPTDLGGFQHARPWREIHITLHAETITGPLEIQVNDTTLKLGTATALIRRPATVVITYDAANAHVTATIGTRQVARATVLGDNFLSTLKCELRCDGGKARLKVNELKIKTQ